MLFLSDLPVLKIGKRVYALSSDKPYTKNRFIVPGFTNFDDTLDYINRSQTNSEYHLYLKRIKGLYIDRIYKNKILTKRIFVKNDLKKAYDYVSEKCPNLKYTYRGIKQYANKNLFYDISLINENVFSKEINNYKFVEEYFQTIIKPIFSDIEYENKYFLFDIDSSNISTLGDIKKSDYDTPNILFLFLYLLKYTDNISYFKEVFGDVCIVFTSKKGLFKINFLEIEEEIKKGNMEQKDILRKIIFLFKRLKSSSDSEDEINEIEIKKDKVEHEIIDTINEDTKEDEETEKLNEKEIEKVIDSVDNPEEAKKVTEILTKVKNKKLERVSEISDKERNYINKVMNVNIGDKSYNELLEEIDDLTLYKESYDNVTSLDNYNENSFINFNKTYEEKLKDFDITEIAQSFSNADTPLFVQNIDVEDSSDNINYTEDVKMKFKDLEGNTHNVKVTLPKMIDGRFIYLSGSKKNIIGQIVSHPITKIGEDVYITTNYNKVRLSYTGGKYLSPIHSRIIRAFNSIENKTVDDFIFDNVYEDNFDTGETTRDYNDISKYISHIKNKNIDITFNYEESLNKYDKNDENNIVLGEVDNNLIILNKETEKIKDGEYKDLSLSEFIYQISEKYIPKFYEEIEKKKTVPKTIVHTSVKILGKDVPLILILTYLKGFIDTLEEMNISYKIVPKDTKPKVDKFKEGIIEFKDSYLVFEYDSIVNISMLSYLNRLDLSGYDLADLEDKDISANILEEETGSHNFPVYLDNYNNLMIDPITKNVLVYFELPTEFTDVLIYANYLLSTGINDKDTDIRNSRIRYEELITATLYDVLAKQFEEYSVAKKRGSTKKKFSIDKNAVIKKLYELPNIEEYSTLNPFREIDKYSSASMKGLHGLNLDRAYTAEKRLYDPSFYGKFSMSSAYSASIGVVKHLSVDPMIKSARGFMENVDLDAVDNLDSKHLISVSEAITAMSTSKDDFNRSHHRVICECVSL